jgi:peptide/nickel transport system permease protein
MGRDVLSRLFYGARVSLVIGLTTVVVSGAIGVLLGLVAGYFGGLVGDLIMRIADVQESFPFLALAIVVVALLGPGLRNTIIVLGVGGWVLFARVVRGDVLGVREKDYILAARALGVGDLRMMFRHILPNVVSPVIVLTTFAFSLMIITEASLSFIGLGVQPPAPSWGRMLGDGRDYLAVAWWLPTFPGLFIMLTVLGANLLGDCLRDMLDPRLRI